VKLNSSKQEEKMKVFEEHASRFKEGHEVDDFPINGKLSLSDLKGYPIFLVFWKTF
jgi:hypothetical protein